MKLLSPIISLLLFLPAFAQEQILIGGSSTMQIAIVDQGNAQIQWSHNLEEGNECNSLVATKEGNIAYSYRQGAKLITREGEVLFDFTALKAGEELQCITDTPQGFLLGLCGNPARVIELNPQGEITQEISIDLGIKNAHSQFRQIRKTDDGHYLIPLLATKKVIKVNSKGEIVKSITLPHGAFSLTQIKQGLWLAPCGHSSCIYQIDENTGEVQDFITKDTLPQGVKICFGAEIAVLPNKNYLLANWQGHNGDKKQATLMEIDTKGQIVGKVQHIQGMQYISALRPYPALKK